MVMTKLLAISCVMIAVLCIAMLPLRAYDYYDLLKSVICSTFDVGAGKQCNNS